MAPSVSLLLSILLLLCFHVTVSDAQQNSTQCNVKDYGAVGDGQTDDTEAVLKAMSACVQLALSAPSAQLYFPLGEYKLVSSDSASYGLLTQDCKSGSVSFLGEDQSGNHARIYWVVSANTNQKALFSSTNCTNFGIFNLDVEVYATAPDPRNIGIARFFLSNGVVITGVRWQLASGSPIAFGYSMSFQNVSTVIVDKCLLMNATSDAISIENTNDVLVTSAAIHNQVIDEYAQAIGIFDGCDDLRFEHLLITDTQRGITFSTPPTSQESPLTVSVSQVAFIDNQYAGIYVTEYASLTVSDCIFNRSVAGGVPTSNGYHGIVIDGRENPQIPVVTVSECAFGNLTGYGITSIAGILRVSNSLFQDIHGGNLAAINFEGNSSQPTTAPSPLTIDLCLFENNDVNIAVSGDRLELLNNMCVGNAKSEVTCFHNDCVDANNFNCYFTPSLHKLHQRIVLRD